MVPTALTRQHHAPSHYPRSESQILAQPALSPLRTSQITFLHTFQVPFLLPPGFRCCYLGGGSTLPRASSVASSSSAVSSSVKSRIFFWRADWGIARGIRDRHDISCFCGHPSGF